MVILTLLISTVQSVNFDQTINAVTQSIANIPYYYVDNNVSDVDSSIDKGTQSNFTAQKFGPDSIVDGLTEEEDANDYTLFLYVNEEDGVRNDWTTVGVSPYLDAVDYNSNYVYASKNNYEVGDFGFEDSGKSFETIQNVNVQLYAKQSDTNNPLEVFVWEGSSWTSLNIREVPNEWGWIDWGANEVLNTWAEIDAAKIYMKTKTGAGIYEVDCARLLVDYSDVDNFELDLEVQWTNVDFGESNEELCIYGGTMGSENIRVDVWNGSAWENLFTDLMNGWNNVTVTTYLTSPTFTIRFKGGTEINDSNQDVWAIDVTLLHVWT
jgi:hypothetical protein